MPIISIVLIVAYFFFIPKRDEFQLIQVGDVRMSLVYACVTSSSRWETYACHRYMHV